MLARDTHLKRYVAVKVSIAKSESDSLLREIQSLRALSVPQSSPASMRHNLGWNSIPRLLDEFEVNDLNGVHVCYTTNPARCNLSQASFNRYSLLKLRGLYWVESLWLLRIHIHGVVFMEVCHDSSNVQFFICAANI